MIQIEQLGEGPELEWIKEKVFGRKIKLPNTALKPILNSSKKRIFIPL
jgi:hypothetical protein